MTTREEELEELEGLLERMREVRRRAYAAAYEVTTGGDDGELVVSITELDAILLDELLGMT